jgi:hypothetical protein
MIAVSAWVWAVVGVVLLLALGLAAALALGLLESVVGSLRRAGGTTALPHSEGGQPMPEEVPERTPAEASEQVERMQQDDESDPAGP